MIDMEPEFLSEFSEKELEELKEIMPAFAPAYSKIYTRFGVTREAKIRLNQDLTVRNIATSRMAGLLGLSKLVVDSVPVSLNSKHAPEEKGVATVMAKGSQINDIASANLPIEVSPEVAKSLINLQFLDFLCGQVDRNSSNLFFTYEERDGKRILTQVTGIDSDIAFGLLSYNDLQRKDGLLQAMPVEFDGNCTLPVLDKELSEMILALNRETVDHVLEDLLEKDELDALWNRIEGMQAMLEKNRNLMKEGAWDKNDVRTLLDLTNCYCGKIRSNVSKDI